MKHWLFPFATLLVAMNLNANVLSDPQPRQEFDVPAPSEFDLDSAEPFEMPGDQRLTYAVVPSTLSIGEDGLLRYVLVATSNSGGKNILFEALDCTSHEHKSLARWSNYRKQWTPINNARWETVRDARSVASLVLVNGVFCENRMNRRSVDDMLRELKRQ